MFAKELEDLVTISKEIGRHQDYIQGGGGNTSVKLNDELMAIKASGTQLKNLEIDSGFVALDYKKMLQYHNTVEKNVEGKDYNKEINELSMANIVSVNGEAARKPSVEVGFHAALRKYVAHSHSVYVNIFTCSQGGTQKAVECLKNNGINAEIVPAVNPGYYLTEDIIKILKLSPETRVFLMENHGLIVTDDIAEEVIKLHKQVNDILIASFNLGQFPLCKVQKSDDGYVSNTDWLKEKLSDSELAELLFTTALYPDQIVYTTDKNKISLTADTLHYNTNETEALAIEETVCGVVYVLDEIIKHNYSVKQMAKQNILYIVNWDSEKYRREIFK